ncbi:MAG: acyl-CoA carboxylase subunit beta [Deltaproteobacteria bacterium]|nr:acyl-CoA carboxylase subunit beta [Deltaproteobacteria bacterium]MBW2360415.1 acyl-CoA carboxylase subunit beta [Deltaproteobacteria bacterium]
MKQDEDVGVRLARIREGGAEKYHQKAAQQGKLFCRERLARLLDADSFVEDGAFANSLAGDLPADGVVTGMGSIEGRRICVMANDSTVKAGSWGARTVEKILRIQERAERLRVPLVYLVDSAGARITDQIQMFPGRRGAGRIFHNQCRLSGMVPQVCLLFGPSAAGGAYIPAFCDVIFMVDGNASMYLGSPRMTEMVIGQKTTLEEMGGAEMHCSVSGVGDLLAANEDEAIAAARTYLAYFPSNFDEAPPYAAPAPPAESPADLQAQIPAEENKPFDMHRVVERVVDAGSFFEIKKRFAGELLTGLARIEGRVVGVVASQPKVKGGVLFVDSADKAARFIWLCDAFGIPLLFLADVPGFMVGRQVERQGIIRAGAKMVMAVSEATVPRICVVIRKAYGAGLYAMSGPGFEPEATLALPGAMIAVMGPDAAVNAVYFNKLEALGPDARAAEEAKLREEYRADIDIERLGSELVVDAIVAAEQLREELAARFAAADERRDAMPDKRRSVTPV